MKKLSFIFLILSQNLFGQFNFEYDASIPVKIGTTTLQMPWGGGLNYAQFSDFDYDYDGDLDLFIFDRSSDNILVYSQESIGGPHYELVYDAQKLFPDDVKYRATLIDFDQDGKKDLFTYGIGGLKVYRNTGDAINGLQWTLFKDLVYSQYTNFYTNLYVSSSDIPAIIDVDGDGDIDVLTFHIGGSHMEYHKNMSMETYGIPDSLIFELKNECWGKFVENVNNNSLTLNDPNIPCVGGAIPNPEIVLSTTEKNYEKHAGSTVLALDYDNSGVLDLVLGDVAFTNLNLLINGGTTVNSDSPMISVDNAFPSNTTPVDIQLFPAAFYLDVDFDNVKDLVVCPNAKNVSFNEKSVYFYKNNGTNSQPNFIFTESNFLQKEMIEHGSGSIPVFSDYNRDGLQDLFVANFYRYKPVLQKESTIAYYQNTGTINSPEFTFVDDDVFNLAMQNYGLRTVPTFGDVDNDGDDDLFLGLEDGTLVYYENTSTGGNAIYTSGVPNYQDNTGTIISTNGHCFPQLFDLDNDGLLDLILGKRSGEIMFFRNIGTSTSPSFELTNPQLGGIDIATTIPDGYPAPHFFRQNDTTRLFIGSVHGTMMFYDSIDTHLAPADTFRLENANFLSMNVGAYSSFFTNDLDNDGFLDLFVGQDLGGLYHFEVDPNSTSSLDEIKLKESFQLFPNPAKNKVQLTAKNEIQRIIIINQFGQIEKKFKLNAMKYNLPLKNLPSGIYYVKVFFENGVGVEKLIIQ